jgi:hypothetical protein
MFEDSVEEASRGLDGVDDSEANGMAELRGLLERAARLLDRLLGESRGLQAPQLSMQLAEAGAFVHRSLLALRERDVVQSRVGPQAYAVPTTQWTAARS